MKAGIFLFFLLVLRSQLVISESAGRFSELRPRTITVCSQNLERYGSPEIFLKAQPDSGMAGFREKQKALLERFRSARCDVIAMQELAGADRREAEAGLRSLIDAIHETSGRHFSGIIGDTFDGFIRCAFLFDEGKVKLTKSISFDDAELPRLSEHQRPRFFLRLPLELVLEVPEGKGAKGSREFRLVTFHFKSKTRSFKDPAGLAFETVRMESAEKLRQLVLKTNPSSTKAGGPLLILLGDRNSDETSASAAILEGRLALHDFQGGRPQCQVGKTGRPLCSPQVEARSTFISVLTEDPDTKDEPGTHRYKNKTEWLDDILIPASNSDAALEDPLRGADYDSGVLSEPRSASDHALVYVRLHF